MSEKSHIDKLIRFLEEPTSYPHENHPIEIVQTHASVIAIGPKFVYKIKKPVNFEFMDFSTVEKRKFYCEEEIRLNRRLSENIYLGVIPIYQKRNGRFTFSDDGEVIDFAVKMRRMTDGGFLSDLIDSSTFDQSHFDRIVNKLCHFYHGLPPQDLDPYYGQPESIAYIINENTEVRRQYLSKTLDPLQEELISRYQQSFLNDHKELLRSRVKQGWVRDTHGDLRLEHFYFDEDNLNVFDCIEFKERLRVNDLVNDFGFLCMELDNVGLAQQSQFVYKELIACTNDQPIPELLNFYKTHRACVRGMVHAVAGYSREVVPNDQVRNQEISRKFFALATRYVMLKDQPTVFGVFGGVATGKSTLSQKLSEIMSIPHIQSDATRKEIAGLKVDDYPDDETREKLYTKEMTDRTYQAVIDRGRQCLSQHRSVILDGRWSKESQKKMLEKAFPEARIVWIQTVAPMAKRERRLKARELNKSISDARLDIFRTLLKGETYDDEGDGTLVIDTSNQLGDCVRQVCHALVQ